MKNINTHNDQCKKKRKSCEYAITELLFAGVVSMLSDGFNMSSITLDNMINYLLEVEEYNTPGYYYTNKTILNCNNIHDYLNDLRTNKQDNAKKKKCIMFIKNLKNEILTNKSCPLDHYIKKNKIDEIIVTGKKIKNEEILKLNKGLDVKDAKSDVYLRLKEEPYWTGWSIKQSKISPKSNYSIILFMTKEEANDLDVIKKSFLQKHNILRITSKTPHTEKKKIRDLSNKIFHDRYNPFWNKCRECISNNNTYIKKMLIQYLYGLKVHYPMYEFDGEEVVDYKQYKKQPIDVDSDIIFSEHEPLYFTKKGKVRKTAKMYYKLSFNNVSYRVEIRFKNDKHISYPQLFCHKI